MTRVVVRNGRVFDGQAFSDADITIENGRFVEVASGLDADAEIDVAGRAILPGLFDCHTHTLLSTIDTMELLQTPFSLHFQMAAQNLRTTLGLGITTVRDAMGADLGLKTAVERGIIPGPRMQISISMISQTGGHADSWMVCGVDVPWLPAYPGSPDGIVDGPEEMRRKVRELVRDGADVIKVATSGGVLSPRDDPRHAHFRDEELRVLVEEATAAGCFVMAHAQGTGGIKAAIKAGIRSIEHGIYLDDEAIQMMLDRGTYLVPTLLAPQGVLNAADAGASIPEASIRKCKEVIDIHRTSISNAIAAGVKVAMGTDCPVSPHGTNLRELSLMCDAGMKPFEALRAATSTAAELLGVSSDLGSIEAGKRADIVIVDGDPFEFDSLPERISAVYKDGVNVA
ncbi:MAG: metal-dependent hydrolase family protein [Actinomycetota bacterium]